MPRTKTVYPTQEIPHLWAHQDTNGLEKARNPHGNLYFEGDTIYSYGSHFPIAQFVRRNGDTAVLFNSRRDSVTTSKQQGLVRAAIPPYYDVFEVPLGRHEFDIQSAVDSYLIRAADLREKADRAKSAKGRYFHQLSELTKQANKFASFYGRPAIFPIENPTDLPNDYFQRLLEEAEAEHNKRNEAREQKRLAEQQQKIERWLAGEDVWFPQGVQTVFLRVKGNQVETSRGAAFPVEHAAKALQVIERVRETKLLYWHTGLKKLRLGDYQVDEIDEYGNVRAGCHFVTYEQIERIAPQLK